jgi:putative ABC transport system permease protein
MMGTFQNLVIAVRRLLLSIAIVAVTVAGLSVFNTALAAIVEQTNELAVMRALGASRLQIASLIAIEALLLTLAGSLVGILLAQFGGRMVESVVKQFVPLSPRESMLSLGPSTVMQCVLLGIVVGVVAAVYPAWCASRLPPAEALKAE